MTKYPNSYYVETKIPGTDKWHAMLCSVGNKSYALGYLTALDGFYPHPEYRLIGKEGEVIKECKARSGVHLN